MSKNRVINGAKWSFIEKFSSQFIQFFLSIFIARLVMPAEYGLIAMLTIFLAVAQIFIDSGFSNALVQKQDRTQVDYSTVFYFNIVLSVILYVLFWFTAPLISNFYDEPRLTLIIRVSFLSLIINAATTIQRTVLQVDFNFKKNAIINLVAIILSGGVGLLLAFLEYGVWALVAQSLLMSCITSVLLWIKVKWKPTKQFSYQSFRTLFNFGSKLLGCALADTIYTNLYNLIIGKAYTVRDLGLYNRAYTLSQLPSRNIYYSLRGVVFTMFCEQQDDKAELEKSYEKVIQAFCYFIFPIMVFLSFFSKEIIDVLLSDKWTGASSYLSILSIAFMFFPVMISLWDLVNSLGYSDYALKAEIIKKVVGISLIVVSIHYGMIALCISSLINNLADISIMTYFSRKITSFGYKKLIRIQLSFLLISLISGFVAYSVHFIISNSILIVLTGSIIFTMVYLLSSLIFKLDQYKIIFKLFGK